MSQTAAANTGSLTNFNPAHPPPLPRNGSNPMVSVANSASPTVTTITSVSVASFTNSCLGNTASSLSITALPTAFVQISGGGYRVPTHTFFDTGSQRTFIQSDLAKQLNLPVVDRITLSLTPFASQPVEIVVVNCLKSKGIKLADGQLTSDDVTQIGLVIGADNYHKFRMGQSKCAGVNLFTCAGGAIIFGPLPQWATQDYCNGNSVTVQHAVCARTSVMPIEIDPPQIENLWKLDQVGIVDETYSPEEKLTVEKFESNITCIGSHYSVDLPFKSNLRPPVNYCRAYGQFFSLARSFKNNPDFFEEYNQIFDNYLQLGFIEKVNEPIFGHYLPHHGVRKDSATTHLRIVFNASSKQTVSDPSLNDCLLTGPSLTAKLFDYLLVFRTNPFAVVSDISKAFLRIGINFNSRDYCRFLWFENSNLDKIVTYRFKVVMFGATCSPFLLQKTIVYHLEHNSDPLASQLIPHFYVDNFCKTYSCLDSMLKEYPCINQILLEANMPLQSWISNSVKFNEVINVDVTEVEINVFGINWNVTHDSLSIKSSQYVCKNECLHHHLTKRQVVSIVSSIFDPLARVAPRPELSIPKLELTALNLGSEMAKSLMSNSALAFQSCTLWTDSEVVLHWVHRNKCTDVYVRNRVKDIRDGEFSNPLTVLVRMEQQFHYPTLIQYLSTASCINVPQDITNFSNQLGLHLNSNGVVCSKGRLQNSALPSSTQTPMLLPPKSHLTMLIIRKLRAQTFPVPNPPPLPSERVTFTRSFDCSGVDFTGAYNVYDVSSKSLNDIPSKAYICSFTCTSSRAIHLELVRTLSTVDFLLALRRFCALYPTPRVIISDNGSNFQGCNQFLQQIKDEPEVLAHLNHMSIQWKFITPRAPWFGGFYERLIGVVKGSLSKALYHKRVTFDELHTVLCEIKSIVNNRPLTYISDSCEEEFLTPNQLLYGRNIIIAPPLNNLADNEIPYGENIDVREQYARLCSVLKKFESIWQNYYLTSLRERHYGNQSSSDNPLSLRENDIVLVNLENNHKFLWPLGKITRLIFGRDNTVRSVEVSVHGKLYERSISKIVPLEIPNPVLTEELNNDKSYEDFRLPEVPVPDVPLRPQRKAAKKAALNRKELLIDGQL
ncbi:uncharacterized protein [Palaemon carinicauda]|uniref:uncharacterized protein n=1 Tax=Palaemon carinicauda TaxID=392227 RepID=UPI0035B5A833